MALGEFTRLRCQRDGAELIPLGLTASGHDSYACPSCKMRFVVADGLLCPTFDNGATFKPGFGVPLWLAEIEVNNGSR